MNQGITAFALKNHITALVMVALLLLSGISSYLHMPKQQDPGFTIRAAVISTALPGASSSKVEQLISDRIEEVLQEIPEVDYIESDSRHGISIVKVHFLEKYKNMRPLFNKVRRKIDDLKEDASLPREAQGPMVNDDYGDVFGILYSLQGEGFSLAELKKIADDMRSRLLSIHDVAKVEIHGAQKEVIYVEYNGARLQKMHLSPSQLSKALQTSNILQSAGSVEIGQERILLEPTGSYENLEALRKTVLEIPGGQGVIYLGDLAKIYRGYVEPANSKVRYNESQGLVLAISLREGGDILALNETLDKETVKMERDYPYGISLKKVFSQPKLVKHAVSSFMSNLGQAIFIVAAIMFAFLGIRTGLIVASLIPTSIAISFVCMSLLGMTINQISLAALIIALGLLVDNAIVICEAIMIQREEGKDSFTAAIDAGREMSIPLLISSLTTAAAFLCIFLAESAVGEYTSDIFKVVSLTLLASWILSMTFIPIMTKLWMRIDRKKNGNKAGLDQAVEKEMKPSWTHTSYLRILLFCLRHKGKTLCTIIALFILSLFALQFVPNVFIPERKDPIINAKFNMPRGTHIRSTEKIFKDLESFILREFSVKKMQGGVIDLLSFIGVGTPRYVLTIDPDPEESHTGAMIIQLEDEKKIPELIARVETYAAKKYPDLEVKMKKMENGTPIDYPVEIRVQGEDMHTLYKIVDRIKSKLLSLQGVRDVSDDWGPRIKKLLIEVKEEQARRAGVSNSDVALSLKTGMDGMTMTEFREKNDRIPVSLRSVSQEREKLSTLDGLMVYAQGSQQSVPLRQVADIHLVWEDAVIKRRDRLRTITVRTLLFPQVTATEISQKIHPYLEDISKNWPANYSFSMGGEMETSEKASQAIADKMSISGMFILLLLLAQFNSIAKTAIILCTIPLGIIGVSFGLLAAGSIFGFFTILGIISLCGIIINNAIVLIDRIQIEEKLGKKEEDAIVAACLQRFRPILLTTLTTVGGMLPLWISHDPMFETMAVSIIFGLLFATVLTLIIVPILYSLFMSYEKNLA